MSFCPIYTIESIRADFNSIVEAFNGTPLKMDEFRSKTLRLTRTGKDLIGMEAAYYLWDLYQGDMESIRQSTLYKNRAAITLILETSTNKKNAIDSLFKITADLLLSNKELKELVKFVNHLTKDVETILGTSIKNLENTKQEELINYLVHSIVSEKLANPNVPTEKLFKKTLTKEFSLMLATHKKLMDILGVSKNVSRETIIEALTRLAESGYINALNLDSIADLIVARLNDINFIRNSEYFYAINEELAGIGSQEEFLLFRALNPSTRTTIITADVRFINPKYAQLVPVLLEHFNLDKETNLNEIDYFTLKKINLALTEYLKSNKIKNTATLKKWLQDSYVEVEDTEMLFKEFKDAVKSISNLFSNTAPTPLSESKKATYENVYRTLTSIVNNFGTVSKLVFLELKSIENSLDIKMDVSKIDFNSFDDLDQYDLIEEGEENNEILEYDKSLFEREPKISAVVKRLFFGISTGEKNFLGKDKYVDYYEALSVVRSILKNSVKDFDSMVNTLRTFEESIPWMKNFVDKLIEASSKNDSIKKAFRNSMAVSYVDQYTLMYGEDRNNNPNMVFVRINDVAVVNNVINTWLDNIADSKYVKQDGSFDSTKLLKDYKEAVNSDDITKIREFMNDLGIEMSDYTWNVIETQGIKIGSKHIKGKKILTYSKLPFVHLINAIKTNPNDIGGVLNIIYNDSSLKRLARYEVSNNPYIFPISHRSGGKTVYSYVWHTYLSQMIEKIKQDENFELLDRLLSYGYYKNNLLLNKIREGDPVYIENVKLGGVSLEAVKNFRSKESKNNKKLGQLTNPEYDLFILGSIVSGIEDNTDAGAHIIPILTPITSDKGTYFFISMPEFDVKLTKNGELTHEALETLYNTVVLPEINRMMDLKDKLLDEDEEITIPDDYKVGGMMFYFIPSLNLIKELFDSDGYIVDVITPQLKQKILNEINNVFTQSRNRKLSDWKKDGTTEYISEKAAEKFQEKFNVGKDTLEEFLAGYVTTQYMLGLASIYTSFFVDVAHAFKTNKFLVKPFKQALENRGINTNNPLIMLRSLDKSQINLLHTAVMYNYNKRSAMFIANGRFNGDENSQVRYLFVQDKAINSLMLDQLEVILGNQAEAYSKSGALSESTNAQEFVTLSEYMKILLEDGLISSELYNETTSYIYDRINNHNDFDYYEKLLEHLEKKELLNEFNSIVFNPTKPVYNWIEPNDFIGLQPVYIKSSAYPLLPSIKNKEITKIRHLMEKHNIDRMVFPSGAKLGTPRAMLKLWDSNGNVRNDINEEEVEAAVKVLSREGLRIQQEVPFHGDKDKINRVSQADKNLFIDILEVDGFVFEGKTLTGSELASIYIERYDELYSIMREKLLDEINYDKNTGTFNKKVLISLIKEEAIIRNHDLLNSGVLDSPYALEFLPYFGYHFKLESLINALIKSRILKIKFPGFSAVLSTEEGYQDSTVVDVSEEDSKSEKSFKTDEFIDKAESTDVEDTSQFDKEDNKKKFRELTPEQENNPFAVFALIRNEEGKILTISNEKEDEIKLPGDLVLKEEDPVEALKRAAQTHGIKIEEVADIVASRMVNGKPVVWYEVVKATTTDTNEKDTLLKFVSKEEIANSDDDNDFIEELYQEESFETPSTKKGKGSKIKIISEDELKSIDISDIIYTSEWKGTLDPGLFTDSNGKVLTKEELREAIANGTAVVKRPAQILIPWRFTINGKKIDIRNFIDPATNTLKLNKIDSSVLEAFGMRIPNVGLSSQSYIQVVGFLPEMYGDLVVASRDFLAQMGSDFDVDKLYGYQSFLYINKRGRLKSITSQTLKEFTRELKNVKYNPNHPLAKYYDNPVSIKTALSNARYYALTGDIKEIHNAIIKNGNPIVIRKNLSPTNYWKFGIIADELGFVNSIGFKNIITDEYHKQARMDANSGKELIGIFAIMNNMQALFQYVKYNIGPLYTPSQKTFPISFGEYQSFGNLSNPLTLRSEKLFLTRLANKYKLSFSEMRKQMYHPKYYSELTTLLSPEEIEFRSDVLGGLIQSAVDNQNQQILDRIGINQLNATAATFLVLSGFSEEVGYLFKLPFVERFYQNLKSELSPLSGEYISFELAKAKALEKTVGEEYATLFDKIREDVDFGSYDERVLSLKNIKAAALNEEKISENKKLEVNLTALALLTNESFNSKIQIINSIIAVSKVDSKFIGTSFEEVEQLYDNFKSLPDKLLETFFKKKTLQNAAYASGVGTAIDLYNLFYPKTSYEFKLFKKLVDKKVDDLWEAFSTAKFTLAEINPVVEKYGGISNLIEAAYSIKSPTNVVKIAHFLKKHPKFYNNKFVQSLIVSTYSNKYKGVSIPSHNNFTTNKDLVKGLLELYTDTEVIEKIKMSPKEYVELLIGSELASGGAYKKGSFINQVHAAIYEDMGIISRLVSYHMPTHKIKNLYVQYLQYNPYHAVEISPKAIVKNNGSKVEILKEEILGFIEDYLENNEVFVVRVTINKKPKLFLYSKDLDLKITNDVVEFVSIPIYWNTELYLFNPDVPYLGNKDSIVITKPSSVSKFTSGYTVNNPVKKEVTDSKSKKHKFADIIQKIVTLNIDNPYHKFLAEEVLYNLKNDPSLQIEFADSVPYNGYYEYNETAKTGNITINSNLRDDIDRVIGVLLHESLHHVYRKAKEVSQTDIDVKKAFIGLEMTLEEYTTWLMKNHGKSFKEFLKLYDEYKKALVEKNYEKAISIKDTISKNFGKNARMYYAATSTEEFMTATLTDTSFAKDVLNNIKTDSGKETLLDKIAKFFSRILKILEIDINDNSLLHNALVHSLTIVSTVNNRNFTSSAKTSSAKTSSPTHTKPDIPIRSAPSTVLNNLNRPSIEEDFKDKSNKEANKLNTLLGNKKKQDTDTTLPKEKLSNYDHTRVSKEEIEQIEREFKKKMNMQDTPDLETKTKSSIFEKLKNSKENKNQNDETQEDKLIGSLDPGFEKNIPSPNEVRKMFNELTRDGKPKLLAVDTNGSSKNYMIMLKRVQKINAEQNWYRAFISKTFGEGTTRSKEFYFIDFAPRQDTSTRTVDINRISEDEARDRMFECR